jgi:hypothetical protein
MLFTEEMAEAYRRCQARRGRASGAMPGTAGYASQRRRSRAVLYHLSGQFEKHNRANRAKTKLQQLNKVILYTFWFKYDKCKLLHILKKYCFGVSM